MSNIKAQNTLKIVDVDNSSLKPETLKYIHENIEIAYKDMNLKEHIYNIDTCSETLVDELEEFDKAEIIKADFDAIQLLINENEAGYFRITFD